MAYVITEPCIPVKDKVCLAACPVEAIHEGARMLYIDPLSCICCAGCESLCPVGAIFEERDVPEKWKGYIRENAAFFHA